MWDYERLKPRSFTGLTNEEWDRFGVCIKAFLGSGKRSMFISTMIKCFNQNSKNEYEQKSQVKDRAFSSIADTFKFLGMSDRTKDDGFDNY